MDTSSEPFQYNPLQANRGQIRLAVLSPGTLENDLDIVLFHHSRENTFNHICALSYIWGCPAPASSITIRNNGEQFKHQFRITPSLDNALRAMRFRNSPRIIWVDALCINQSDDLERSSQVSMMRTIYSSCSEVIVYLGPDDTLITTAVDIILHSMAIGPSGLHPENYITVDEGLLFSHPLRKLLHKYPVGLKALAYFYSRPYWSRIWVVQEISVSQRATVYWGNRVMSWESCLHFTALLMNYAAYVRRSAEYGNEDWKIIDAGLDFAVEVCQISEALKTTGFGCPLLDLLQRFWLTEASDSRDKVFGLLGLATDGVPSGRSENLMPDYGLDEGSVFGRTVKDVLLRTGNLDILGYCSGVGAGRRLGVPTWAADWTAEGRRTMIVEGTQQVMMPTYVMPFDLIEKVLRRHVTCGRPSEQIFCASGRVSSPLIEVQFSDNFKVLGLEGIIVDTVKELSRTQNPQEDFDRDWSSMANKLKELYLTEELFRDAFLRTLSADQIFVDQSSEANWETMLRFLGCTTLGRRFMLTEGQSMGLAPRDAKVGDFVSIVKAARMPLILRKEGEKWILVGECYIHGIMFGELLKDGWGNIPNPTVKFEVV